MRTIDDVVNAMSAEDQAEVRARAAEIVAEHKTLQAFRKAHRLTQQDIATRMKIDQARVSKIEKGSDMLISTLRTYIEAAGGTLSLTVQIGDGVVEVVSIGEIVDDATAGVVAHRENAKRTAKPRTSRLV